MGDGLLDSDTNDFVWEHEEYAFYLPGPWRRLATDGDDPLQLRLVSDPLETHITFSIEPVPVPRDELGAWAERLLSVRRASHEEWLAQPANRAPGRKLVIADQKLSKMEGLDSIEVSYTGQITGVGLFGFIGYVTTRKVVNMFCETRLSFSPSRRGVFQRVARGFKNKLP